MKVGLIPDISPKDYIVKDFKAGEVFLINYGGKYELCTLVNLNGIIYLLNLYTNNVVPLNFDVLKTHAIKLEPISVKAGIIYYSKIVK